MVQDPGDLAEQHADILGARRRRDAQQFLDAEREGVLLAHRRDVIQAVEIGSRLEIGLVLDQLFSAAVEQTDMRIGPLDHFAVHFQHEAQHPVGRRVLRPEIHRERLDLRFGGGCRGRHYLLLPGWAAPVGRLSLFVARQHDIGHAFPGAEEIE